MRTTDEIIFGMGHDDFEFKDDMIFDTPAVRAFMKRYAKEVIEAVQEDLYEYIDLIYGTGYGDCSCSYEQTDAWTKLKEGLK